MTTPPEAFELAIISRTNVLDARVLGLEQLDNERDRRYTERFESNEKSVKTALDAAKEAVQAALVAAEKAVAKAELAQERHNQTTNDYRAQLKEQAQLQMPRTEADSLFRQTRDLIDGNQEDISRLREQIVKLAGRQLYEDSSSDRHVAKMDVTLSTIVGALAILMSLSTLIYLISSHH